METLNPISTSEDTFVVDVEAVEPEIESIALVLDPEELAFEIGAWLSGLRAFATTCQAMFAVDGGQSPGTGLYREFRITHLAIRSILKLCRRLRRTPGAESVLAMAGLSWRDLDSLSAVLRDATALSQFHSSSPSVGFEVWRSWTEALFAQLDSTSAEHLFRAFSRNGAYSTLPRRMRELFDQAKVPTSDRIDYVEVVPRVATSLRYLEVVGRMMRNDEPLKPALLILSAVYSQAREMIDHLNLRLERHEDQESSLFNSLDSASYSASLEIKKVFKQEMRGMIGVLPPTSVFARIETAYSLLLDSFQQILLDLAKTIDPSVTLFDFFPRFQIKLDQSMILREHLWQILKAVRAAEGAPEKPKVDHLKQELADFVTITIRFLHYKDEETFERFNEEVHAALDKKDLVPVLHRFGAYLETLFGQVCMRAVLVDHPFQHGN